MRLLSKNFGLTGEKYRNTEPVLDATKHIDRFLEMQNGNSHSVACGQRLCAVTQAVQAASKPT